MYVVLLGGVATKQSSGGHDSGKDNERMFDMCARPARGLWYRLLGCSGVGQSSKVKKAILFGTRTNCTYSEK